LGMVSVDQLPNDCKKHIKHYPNEMDGQHQYHPLNEFTCKYLLHKTSSTR
jgi:hypothetical protein